MYKRAPNSTHTYSTELTKAAIQQLERCPIANSRYNTASAAAISSIQVVSCQAAASWAGKSAVKRAGPVQEAPS